MVHGVNDESSVPVMYGETGGPVVADRWVGALDCLPVVGFERRTPYNSLLTELFLKYLVPCLKTHTKIYVNTSA